MYRENGQRKEDAMRVEFNSILCATDLSDFSNSAALYGAAIAKEFNAQLTLCTVVDVPTVHLQDSGMVTSIELLQNLHAYGEEQLNLLRKTLNHPAEILVEEGLPAETLARMVKEQRMDLLITATHGRSGVQRLFLGSVTERLIRGISCPMMIITPPGEDAVGICPEGLEIKKILVGCDFSPDSGRALDYGFSLAQEFEAELHLVHVIEPFAYRDSFLPTNVMAQISKKLEPEMLERLSDRIPEEVGNWCEVRTVMLTGKPHRELRLYAKKEGMDLIVLGVRGRGLVESLMIGSTTDRVIRQVTCPVLSVSQSTT